VAVWPEAVLAVILVSPILRATTSPFVTVATVLSADVQVQATLAVIWLVWW
jgi:hypothetical protein